MAPLNHAGCRARLCFSTVESSWWRATERSEIIDIATTLCRQQQPHRMLSARRKIRHPWQHPVGFLCRYRWALGRQRSFYLMPARAIHGEQSSGDGDDGELARYQDWLRRRLKLNNNEMEVICWRYPPDSRTAKNIERKLDYFQSRLATDDASLGKVILRFPQLLQYSIENKIEPTMEYMRTRLRIDEASLCKIILRFPQLMGLNVANTIEPRIRWLEQSLDLDAPAISEMIQKFPALMYLSIHDNMEPTLVWFRERLNLDDHAVAELVRRFPPILACCLEGNVKPTLNWLERRFRLTPEGLADLLQKKPNLLGYSVETNLEPTLKFYSDALGSEDEAVSLVLQDPNLLGRSLENRLKPRLEEAKQADLLIDVGCLKRIALYTDGTWKKSLDFQARQFAKRLRLTVTKPHG